MVELLGWIVLLVFGSWIGSLINTYYVVSIYRELKKLNQENQVVPHVSGVSASFSSASSSRTNDSKKYCEKCSSIHKKPESQK